VATDHVDIFFLFFVELAVFFIIVFVQKQKTIYNVLAGIGIGAAILSKWLPALIVLPIWILLAIDSKNFNVKSLIFQFMVLCATCLLIALPWQLYIYKAFPVEAALEAGFNYKHITEVLEGQGGPFYYFLDKIRINYGELIYLPLAWFFWKTVKNISNFNRIAICIWFFIPFLFFSFVKTKMQAYILFSSPALFIMTAEFWTMLSAYKTNHKYKWFFNLILFLLIALPVRYAIERVKPFEITDRKPQWVISLKALNEKKIARGVLFNYERPIEAMFYTNLTVYPNIPDQETIKNLMNRNYRIVINDNGKIPPEIISSNDVILVNLISPEE
jgi:4-amino-4-deoxy-L-arabinose transferase